MKQYHYKKVIGFTEQQRQAFVILEDHGVNINKFIRQAIAEKIKKDWKEIKAEKTTFHNIGAGNTLIPKGGCEECDCNAFKLLITIF